MKNPRDMDCKSVSHGGLKYVEISSKVHNSHRHAPPAGSVLQTMRLMTEFNAGFGGNRLQESYRASAILPEGP